MKAFIMLAITLGMAGSAVVLAKDPANGSSVHDPNATLAKALNAAVTPPGQAKNADSPSQGAEHASQRAIDVVCSKDTPAAQRAAICQGPPVSPD
jgi:hypothetical protein